METIIYDERVTKKFNYGFVVTDRTPDKDGDRIVYYFAGYENPPTQNDYSELCDKLTKHPNYKLHGDVDWIIEKAPQNMVEYYNKIYGASSVKTEKLETMKQPENKEQLLVTIKFRGKELKTTFDVESRVESETFHFQEKLSGLLFNNLLKKLFRKTKVSGECLRIEENQNNIAQLNVFISEKC
jgi:chromosome segregation ATPase